MDSAHAEAAILLINAGADRTRVRIHWTYPHGADDDRGTPSFAGKSRWRDSRKYPRGRRTGAETCETACH